MKVCFARVCHQLLLFANLFIENGISLEFNLSFSVRLGIELNVAIVQIFVGNYVPSFSR